jgi:hypothetical protein
MAANTCFAFLLTGIAIVILRRARLVGALLGSVVLSIGTVALAGLRVRRADGVRMGTLDAHGLLSSLGSH